MDLPIGSDMIASWHVCGRLLRHLFGGAALSLGIAAASGQPAAPAQPRLRPAAPARGRLQQDDREPGALGLHPGSDHNGLHRRPRPANGDPVRPVQALCRTAGSAPGVEGRAPSDGDKREFREIGERMAKRRAEDKRDTRQHTGDELKINLNSRIVTPDLLHATVVSEDATSVTYAVPLRERGASGSSAFEAFQVTARISKQRHEFEHATFRQRTPMRVDLVAKVLRRRDRLRVRPGRPGLSGRDHGRTSRPRSESCL